MSTLKNTGKCFGLSENEIVRLPAPDPSNDRKIFRLVEFELTHCKSGKTNHNLFDISFPGHSVDFKPSCPRCKITEANWSVAIFIRRSLTLTLIDVISTHKL